MLMGATSPRYSSLASSPFSSPNVSALLKIKIISWSQETGLPVSVQVRVGDRIFHLHRNPLYSKSGYFKRRLKETTELELPQAFPGGPEAFEMMALFMYGSSTLIDPFNIAALRCAASFLEMKEASCSVNLCERFDLYLNQVVLKNWDDTLIVLQRCLTLIPWSEELLIVSRCIESLAFMTCMEILDPERRRDKPVVTLKALAGQAWSYEAVKKIVSQELWIKDLIALPFGFFKRIIGSLRRQGMKEKYVSPIIVSYANKWVLSKKTIQYWESSGERTGDASVNDKVLTILNGLLDLLPMQEKANRVVPVGFYFALLSRSIDIGLESDRKVKLQNQIASLLQFAQVEDLLIPKGGIDSICSSLESATMESIFSTYVSSNIDTIHTPSRNSNVAHLWDIYLSRIASDSKLRPKRFMELIEIVPTSCRQSHDQLYTATSTFFQTHLDITQDEKDAICRYLNCQKLSQVSCIGAVQNELMPLRLIVQALFIQQLHTHQALKECSGSFRYAHCEEFSGSLSSSRCPNSKSQYLADSSYTDEAEPGSRNLSFLLQKDIAMQRCEFSRKEYESTSSRIQNLEQELLSLKKSLQLQKPSKTTETLPTLTQGISPYGMQSRSLSKNRNLVGHATGCMGSLNLTSQRKYAKNMLKIFSQITFFGSRKSKQKSGVSSILGIPI